MSAGNVVGFQGVDQVGGFWLVTRPDHLSVIEDICFKTDTFGVVLQVHGGLDPKDVIGLYRREDEAAAVAQNALAARI